MKAKPPPPWKRPRPAKGRSTRLSAADRKAARARAQRAGRRYPNLVDNMWAAARKGAKRRSPRARRTQ